MDDKFDEFLEEVQQDIKQEKYMQLWQRYGKQATTAAVGLLAIAAVYVLWTRHEHQKRLKASEALFSVQRYLFENKLDEAFAVLESMNVSDQETYGYLRLFQKAAILKEKGDAESLKAASSIYDDMQNVSRIPNYIREYAAFLSAKMAFETHSKSSEDVLKILEPMTGIDAPWRLFALELSGLIHYTQNDFDKALEVFSNLAKDKDLPENMRMRVQMMHQLSAQNRNPVTTSHDDDAEL